LFFATFHWSTVVALVRLHKNEDVVHTDSQDEERYDLNDDQTGRETTVTEDAEGTTDGQQDDDYA
jgi:hypothetical protein